MRLKGVLLAALITAALTISCGSLSFRPMFDMSTWTTDTYPAFGPSGLYDAQAPRMPSASSGSVDLEKLNYAPVFDMSPGAFSFNTYPTFSGSGGGGTGIVYGMMAGIRARGL